MNEPEQSFYHDDARRLQDEFDSRRVADRLRELQVHYSINAGDRHFIERAPMFFLATADTNGRPECSFKGGAPGFVRVIDDKTLMFPNYDGNGMFRSLGNLRQNPHVALLFIDFERPARLRISGRASFAHDDPETAGIAGIQGLVTVEVDYVFPNCPRYIPQMQRVEPHSVYVPRPGYMPPVPEWKAERRFRDFLPRTNPAHVTRPGTSDATVRLRRALLRRVVRLRKGLTLMLIRFERRLGAVSATEPPAAGDAFKRPRPGLSERAEAPIDGPQNAGPPAP